jgi:predicted enzyme related to lactoylglutathione lyase
MFAWFELVTPNVEATKAFYGSVVGWTFESAAPGSDYIVASAGGQGVAGLMALAKTTRPPDAGPIWMGYIDVDEVDATLEQLVKAGGRILRPAEDIPGMLRFAVVADPQGIAFVVFTPDPQMQGPPPLARGTLGKFGWNELITSNWEAAFDFYSGLFGWTKGEGMDMGPMGVYQLWIASGSDPDGGMMNKPPGMPGPGHWAYYINVDSIEAAIGRLTAAGGKLIMGPQEVPGPMWVAQGLDPQGALFSLLSTKP